MEDLGNSENPSVAMLLEESMEGTEVPAQETDNIEGNGSVFVDHTVVADSTGPAEAGSEEEHLMESDMGGTDSVGNDGNLTEDDVEANQEGYMIAVQEDSTCEGMMQEQQGDVDMIGEHVEGSNSTDETTDDTQPADLDGAVEPMDIAEGTVSSSEDFSGDKFMSHHNALIVQNEPPQQLMEEPDTPGEGQVISDAADTTEDEGAIATNAPNSEGVQGLYTLVEDNTDRALEEHQEDGILLQEEGEGTDQSAVPDSQETLPIQVGFDQHATSDQMEAHEGATLEDLAEQAEGEIPAEILAEHGGDAMEMPLEGAAGISEGTEGYVLAGPDQLKESLDDLEGKIVVGPEGNVSLLTGPESLQGIQLMEGDDKPEDQANGEDAEAQMQQDIRAQLHEALLKQGEIKQEEDMIPEDSSLLRDQPNAEADALATLASLASAAPSNGVKSEPVVPEIKPDSNEPQWMDVGICKGTHCVVRSFYVPGENQSWDKNWEGINTTTLPDHRALAKLELEAGKAYKFRVAAINSCGRGPWSEISAFRTSMPGVPGAPSAIKISKTTEGAHLSWEPPSYASGVIEDYTVYMAVRSATTDSQVVSSGVNQLAFVRIYQGAENQCSVGFETLNEAHIDTSTKPAILFRIAARNEKGLGPAIQVRWLQDGTIPTNAKPTNAPRRVGGDIKPHASVKRKKSECE